MILTNRVVGEESSDKSSLDGSINEEENRELENIINFNKKSKYFFNFIIRKRTK